MAKLAPHGRTRKAPEHRIMPKANLCGIGRRSPILLYSAARIGLASMIQNGFSA
ncbi:hypothetical protein D3C74_481870 [compost metagenome]